MGKGRITLRLRPCIMFILSLKFSYICSYYVNLKEVFKNKSPIIIGHEVESLKKKLKEYPNPNLLLINYEVDSFSVENIKNIYKHSNQLYLAQTVAQEKKIIPIINFKLNYRKNFEYLYNQEVQMANLLRGFVSGRYTSKNNFFLKNETIPIPYLRPIGNILRNVFDQQLTPYEYIFLKSDGIPYKGKLKKVDSYLKKKYDCARHVISVEDVNLNKDTLLYLNEVENPIIINLTGKVQMKKLLSLIETIKRNEKGDLILVFSYQSSIIMKKQMKRLIKEIKKNGRNNIIYCMSFTKLDRIERDLDFFYSTMKENNLYVGGVMMNFKIKNNQIIS